MKQIIKFRLLGIGLACVLYTSCMEDPLKVDLSDTDLNLETQVLYDIEGVTYQVPPIIGSKTKLYLGTDDEFVYKVVLLKSSFYSFESSAWTLSSFLDTTVKIDSAFFTIRVAKDTLETPATFSMYYFPSVGLDSVFSESQSHYLNFTDTEIAAGEFVSTATEEGIEVDSITTNYTVKFPAVSLFDSTFADTSLNYSLMIIQENGNDELQVFTVGNMIILIP